MSRILFAVTIFTLNVCFLIAHLTATFKFLSINLEDSLFALMGAIGISGIIYTMIVAFFLRHQLNAIFEKLSEISDHCEYIWGLLRNYY